MPQQNRRSGACALERNHLSRSMGLGLSNRSEQGVRLPQKPGVSPARHSPQMPAAGPRPRFDAARKPEAVISRDRAQPAATTARFSSSVPARPHHWCPCGEAGSGRARSAGRRRRGRAEPAPPARRRPRRRRNRTGAAVPRHGRRGRAAARPRLAGGSRVSRSRRVSPSTTATSPGGADHACRRAAAPGRTGPTARQEQHDRQRRTAMPRARPAQRPGPGAQAAAALEAAHAAGSDAREEIECGVVGEGANRRVLARATVTYCERRR